MKHNAFMDEYSLKLMKLFNERETISLKGLSAIYNQSVESFTLPINYLIKNEYLEIHPNYIIMNGSTLSADAPIRITYYGKVSLEAELISIKRFKTSELRLWIATVLSIIATIISVFSLVISLMDKT